MKAGDILIYLGSTYHSGGANISQTPRTGIVISYCLGWLRQFENQYFAAPPNVARHFSSELQDLLGYSVHRPNLGMYEGTEPRVLLAEFDQKKIVSKDCLTEDQNEIIKKIQAVEDSGLTLPAHIDELLAPAPLVQQVSRSDV